MTCNTQGNPHHAKLQGKNQEHILHTIKPQKRRDPKVDESAILRPTVKKYSLSVCRPTGNTDKIHLPFFFEHAKKICAST